MAFEKMGWPLNIISEISGKATADVFFNEFRFEQTLLDLEGRYYEIIIQHFKNGVSYRDLGKEMELSNSRIGTIASDGIRKLRRRQKEFFGVDYDSIDTANRVCKSLSEENELMKKELYRIGVDVDVAKSVNQQLILMRKIDEFDLGVRTYNTLLRSGIKTLGDISKLGRTEALIKSRLYHIKNFGKSSMKDLEKHLSDYGYSLEMLAAIEYERWYKSMQLPKKKEE